MIHRNVLLIACVTLSTVLFSTETEMKEMEMHGNDQHQQTIPMDYQPVIQSLPSKDKKKCKIVVKK